MRQTDALKLLAEQAANGRFVFARRDLERLLRADQPATRAATIGRLVESGWLKSAARGVLVYPAGQQNDGYDLERIARAIRRGEYSYISLESALSEWGAISQVPMGHLTIMTTGRKGVFPTPWGTIEFTHTARPLEDILQSTLFPPGRPLRLATPETAWRDLKRVGRNCEMVDREALTEIIEERCAE